MKPIELLEKTRASLCKLPVGKVAAASGISEMQVRRVRNGESSPTIDTLQRIVDGMAEVRKEIRRRL